MVDGVKELLYVEVNDPVITLVYVEKNPFHRRGAAPVRAEAVAVVAEHRLIDFAQLLCDHLLDHSVYHRGDAQGALLAVRLGNVHTFHRLGAISPSENVLPKGGPVLPEPRIKVRHPHLVDPGCTLVRLDCGYGSTQVSFAYDFFNQSHGLLLLPFVECGESPHLSPAVPSYDLGL